LRCPAEAPRLRAPRAPASRRATGPGRSGSDRGAGARRRRGAGRDPARGRLPRRGSCLSGRRFFLMSHQDVRESAINIIAEGTRLEGTVTFDQVARVHGTLSGEVRANPGSTLILAETAVVEGNIQ